MTQHYAVYDPNGLAPTLAACDHKDPTKIEVLGTVKGMAYEKDARVHSIDGISPTILNGGGTDTGD